MPLIEGAKEEVLDLEEVDLIQEIDTTLVQEGMKKNQANQTGQTIRPRKKE